MVVLSSVAGLALAALLPQAVSAQAANASDDSTFLQNALSQAYLASAFYSSGLQSFSSADFITAGNPDWVRRRVVQINQHAATHQSTIQTLLSSSSAASSSIPTACTYSFNLTTPLQFLNSASRLEQLSASAYLTSLASLGTDNLKDVSAIMLNIGRHSAWLDSAALHGSAWSSAEETLVPEGAEWETFWSWVGTEGWVQECPSTNPTLPLSAWPSLANSTDAEAGSSFTLTSTASASSSSTQNFVIYHGLETTLLSVSSSGSVDLPVELQGTVYGFLTSASNASDVTSSNILAGPLVLDLGLASDAISL